MSLYESLAKAPSGVQEALKSSHFTPKGAIQVFEAENPEEFYKTYVQAGEVLTITNPMTVKKELGQTGGKYENTAYQLDFGSAYITDTVVNNVPTVKPTKKNLNKAGVNIDGKQVLADSVNYYKVTADYSQYKGIEADKDRIGKGFYIVDDYPEEAVTINQDGVQVTDSKGQVVKGLKMALYDSLDKAPSGVQESLESSHFTPKGAIQVFEAENPEEFYKTYVQAGEVLTITNPMTVKKELGQTGGKYENTAYQLDFGSAYITDTVVNNVPTVKPTKKNLNKAGVNIDGKQVLADSVNYYKVTADYSQYKGIEADKDRIGKGFYIVDDYPEEAVTINQDGVQVTDSKGQVVKDLKMSLYESLAKAPSGVQEALKSSHFTPKGAIQVFEAENPEEFYKTYVQAGEVLTITNPMTVKKELGQTGGKYENTAYQIDFGMDYVTETVVNNVPKIEPKKDVVIDHLSKESLDGKEVKLNQTFNYKLVGSLVPKDRSEQLFEYKFSDDYDETHDDYQSVYKVFAAVDFETSDGQKFKAGDELTKFTSQVVDKAKGKVDISFDDALLKSILETSEFQAEVYLQMTRIQSGAVENTYYHTVNGVEVASNTVVTQTPEEPKTPEEHPQQPERSLPSTGEQASAELLLAGLAMGGAASGLLYSKRKKKEA
ncbi:agglutinin receptor [Streptococcus pneumoniae]|nr:agglutinin receptor [Streptococcus pneumoniae]